MAFNSLLEQSRLGQPATLHTPPIGAKTRPAGSLGAEVPELDRIADGLITLSQSCAEAMAKAIQHYQGDAAWMIGALPATESIADTLEAEARTLLTNSQMGMRQIDLIATHLKSVSDLRAVAKSARHLTQMAWLFRQDSTSAEAMLLIRRIGEAAVNVSLAVSEAMDQRDWGNLRQAALTYRAVDSLLHESEAFLRTDVARTTFSPAVHRMARSGVWFTAIAAECMARVAARNAV